MLYKDYAVIQSGQPIQYRYWSVILRCDGPHSASGEWDDSWYESKWNEICQNFYDNRDYISDFVLGREVSPAGRPHIQGFIRLVRKDRHHRVFERLLRITGAPENRFVQLEKAKSPALLKNYCYKDDDYVCYADYTEKYQRHIRNITLNEFQKKMEKALFPNGSTGVIENDDRKIVLATSQVGNNGKTTYQRYLHGRASCILWPQSGSVSSSLCSIIKQMNKFDSEQTVIVLINVCRTDPRIQEDSFWASIESLRDGFVSASFNGNSYMLDKNPHDIKILVCGNMSPQTVLDKVSPDRWIIVSD